MSQYAFAALISFCLLAMGLSAGILGTVNYLENRSSTRGWNMFMVCWAVFFWNFGYAWMGMCYDEDFAYIARAISLLAVSVYMLFIIKYISGVTNFHSRINNIILYTATLSSVVAWTKIIQKNAVVFKRVPWGYWYASSMSWGRILQFIGIVVIIVQYYIILNYGRKNATKQREKYVLNHFFWFGPIMVIGIALDTFVPTLFKTMAIPGSSIAAFCSAMLLFRVSRKHKTFGLSISNVAEYVFKDVSIPVLITDEKENIIMFNEAAPKYLGCSADKIKGINIYTLFSVEDQDGYRVNGTDKICTLDITDVADQFDELLYNIFFIRDVTEEREHMLLLNESREIAEKANQAKSEFLANMSHEIRTPLNAVLGIDEMIIRESEDKTILDYAHNIKQAGNMLLSLINDILDFSKIESGKMELAPVEFNTGIFMNDVYMIVERRAKDKNLELKFDLDPTIPSVIVGDDVRLRQILINILTNSIKYTNQGSVSFSAKVIDKSAEDLVKLHISIVDTGIGIREEELENLFNAFQRADLKKNRNVEGTGLGLSITSSLLKLMGSQLMVRSEYGKGSEFYFDIEFKVVDSAPAKMKSEKLDDEKKITKKECIFTAPEAAILVVDDNKVNLKVAGGLLKRTGVVVTTALSGQESIELVKKNKYDIILMDHMMPLMDGVETVAHIKELVDIPSKDAVIIALTANAISGAKEMFLENGFDDFIPKPIKASELEEKILKYLPPEKVIMKQ